MPREIETNSHVKGSPIVDRTVELNATEARQGSRGRPVLWVLIAGLILAIAAWGAAELYGFSIAPQEPAPAASGADSNTEPPAQDVIDSSPAPGDAQPQRGIAP